MAISKNAGRQSPLVATLVVPAASISAAGSYNAIDLPPGALLLGGFIYSTLTGVTNVELVVNDKEGETQTTTLVGTYAANARVPLDIDTVSLGAYTVPMTAVLVTTGTATGGELLVSLEYSILNRASISEG